MNIAIEQASKKVWYEKILARERLQQSTKKKIETTTTTTPREMYTFTLSLFVCLFVCYPSKESGG